MKSYQCRFQLETSATDEGQFLFYIYRMSRCVIGDNKRGLRYFLSRNVNAVSYKDSGLASAFRKAVGEKKNISPHSLFLAVF